MADLNSKTSYYSDSDYTGLADYYMHKLAREFKCLHTQEEYRLFKQALDDRLDSGKYDSESMRIFTNIYNIFKDELPETREFENLDSIRSLTPDNREDVNRNADALAKRLKNKSDLDAKFLEDLYKLQGRHLKGSRAYIRRLVIYRLREISPEFVCARDENGAYLTEEEGPHKGRKALREDIAGISTQLLILKQFIKQFGWGEGVPAEDKSGRAFQCYRLKKIIGDKSFAKAAEDITEEVFDSLQEEKDAEGNLKGGKEANNLRLVHIAKNIGNAFFQRNWNTREDLYVFSIAFEMTWSPTMPDPGSPAYETDIRKNLFYDFYSENLLDLLQMDDASREKTEKFITGYGINYKNFMEVSYLYVLSKNNMSALDKLRKARSFIEALTDKKMKKSQSDAATDDALHEDVGIERSETENINDESPEKNEAQDMQEYAPEFSLFYLNSIITAINEMDDAEFFKFLQARFEHRYDPEDLRYRKMVKPYEYASDMRTADAVYGEITCNEYRNDSNSGRLLTKIDSSLFPADVSDSDEDRKKRKQFLFIVQRFNDLLDREETVLNFDKSDDEDLDNAVYNALVLKIRDDLGIRSEDVASQERVYFHRVPQTGVEREEYTKRQLKDGRTPFGDKIITRSTMLIAIFNYLTASAMANKSFFDKQPGAFRSANFGSFYTSMLSEVEFTLEGLNNRKKKTYHGINQLLVECGFMEMNPKNIFDLLLVYSAYKSMFDMLCKAQLKQGGD